MAGPGAAGRKQISQNLQEPEKEDKVATAMPSLHGSQPHALTPYLTSLRLSPPPLPWTLYLVALIPSKALYPQVGKTQAALAAPARGSLMVSPSPEKSMKSLAEAGAGVSDALPQHPETCPGPHLSTHNDEVGVGPQPVQEDLDSGKEAFGHEHLQFLLDAALIPAGAPAGFTPLGLGTFLQGWGRGKKKTGTHKQQALGQSLGRLQGACPTMPGSVEGIQTGEVEDSLADPADFAKSTPRLLPT